MAAIGLNRSRQAPAEETPSFGSIAERFRRAGDLDRAIALCEEGLKKFPNQLSARVTLGWSLLDKGEYDLARKELERVLRRAPDNLAAIRGLAELHDRAEHAVSGLGPDGTWSAPEEAAEEPAAQPVAPPVSEPVAVKAPPAVAAVRPEPIEPPKPAASVAPVPVSVPLPVRATVSSKTEVSPLSLIETPAQAAIAHSQPPGSPAPSVFEHVPDRPAEVVQAATEPEVITAAFEEIDPETPSLQPDLAALDAWDLPNVAAGVTESVSDRDAEPVLLAENAEIELAQVASELTMAASDAPAAESVIDLPLEEGALEGALLQFEEPAAAAESFDSSESLGTLIAEPAAFEAEALDPVLPPADAEFTAAVELVNDAAASVAIEPEPQSEVVLEAQQLPEPELAVAPQVEALPEPEVEVTLEAQALPEPELEGVPEVEALPEPEIEVALEPQPAEDEIEVAAEPEMATEPVFAGGAVAAFEDTRSPEPVHATDAIEDEFGSDDADTVAPPEATWLPPAVVHGHDVVAAAPAAAASIAAADMNATGPSPTARVSPPARPSPLAPIAALESFLQKVSARRLHLTPGSVA